MRESGYCHFPSVWANTRQTTADSPAVSQATALFGSIGHRWVVKGYVNRPDMLSRAQFEALDDGGLMAPLFSLLFSTF